MQLTKDTCGVLKIAGTLHISTAAELRNALRDWVSGEADPVIELSGVDECDASALQLLCSALKTAERCNKALTFAGVSATIREAGASLGILLPEEQPAKGGPGAI